MNRNIDKPVKRDRRSGCSIAFGIVLFSVVSAGAWFLFSPDNLNKKLSRAISTFNQPLQTDNIDDQNGRTGYGSPRAVQQTANTLQKEGDNWQEQKKSTETEDAAPLPEESLVTEILEDNLLADSETTGSNPPGDNPQELIPRQNCEELSNTLVQFFAHIDRQPYLKEFKLQQPILNHFNELTDKLLKNPPVVTRESDDLYTILTNMAHFFRVIGKDNILLIKGILDRERGKIEDVAAELYKWSITDRCSSDKLQINLPLAGVYEYAGFFLNTMGGRSYLFRRDSRSRLLVNYYAILIIDQANRENINAHGLDVREMIPTLIREIEATNQLIYKEDYLDTLSGLLQEYQSGNIDKSRNSKT